MQSDITNLNDLTIQGDIDIESDAPVKRHYGRYRGTVMANEDPERRGRVLVTVPDVLGLFFSTWALPSAPVAGPQMGIYLVPPPVGAHVWIEFEHGDPEYPVWVGGWWGTFAEVPASALGALPGAPIMVLQLPSQTGIVMSDPPLTTTVPPMPLGGLLLKAGASSILIDPSGITIRAPIVNINNGALIITLV